MRPDAITIVIPCMGGDCETAQELMADLPKWPTWVIRDLPYGQAIKHGLSRAQTPWALTMDGDGQHTPDDVRSLYEAWRGPKAALHIGYRHSRPVGPRSASSRLLNLAASILAGVHVPDFGSGLRIMRKELVLPWMEKLPDGFDFNAAVTMKAMVSGAQVSWSPIPDRPRTRGRSHVRWVDGIKTLGTLVRTSR